MYTYNDCVVHIKIIDLLNLQCHCAGTQTYRARHGVLLVRVPFQVYTKYSEFPFDMPATPMRRLYTPRTEHIPATR